MALIKSEFLSAFGIAYQIFKSLVDEVKNLGGNDENLRRIETDPVLRRQVAELIVGSDRITSKFEAPTEPIEKFALLADLGTIIVPDSYVHGKQLESFGKKNRKKFADYDNNITDKNFDKATVQLTPGRKLHVRAFKQVVSGTTTSEERMAFLAKQKAIHTGAQGLSLVFEQKKDELPKGFWYASFDEKEALWKDARGDYRVPFVDARSGGGFDFGLGSFGIVWDDGGALLCFCDAEQSLGA